MAYFMIHLFYILPIYILTHQIYCLKYGEYEISFYPNDIINSFLKPNTWFAFLTFCGIFILVGIVESILLPYLTHVKKKEKLSEKNSKLKAIINSSLKKFSYTNAYTLKASELKISPVSYYSEFYKIPVAILLYAICFLKYPIIASILFLIGIYLLISVYKILFAYKC